VAQRLCSSFNTSSRRQHTKMDAERRDEPLRKETSNKYLQAHTYTHFLLIWSSVHSQGNTFQNMQDYNPINNSEILGFNGSKNLMMSYSGFQHRVVL
jgi:hypothetical protein